VSVHHFVASLTTRRYDTGQRTSDLLGVNYWREVPADAEFPRTLNRLDLFARFYLFDAKPVEFIVQLVWNDHPSRESKVIGDYGPFRVGFRRDDAVRDAVFHLPMIRLQGAGLHSIELLRERKRGWQTGELVTIAKTHFLVER